MGKMKEHDEKHAKDGNRGSNFGMGKQTHSRGDLSEGEVKKGYKGMGSPSLKDELKRKK